MSVHSGVQPQLDGFFRVNPNVGRGGLALLGNAQRRLWAVPCEEYVGPGVLVAAASAGKSTAENAVQHLAVAAVDERVDQAALTRLLRSNLTIEAGVGDVVHFRSGM